MSLSVFGSHHADPQLSIVSCNVFNKAMLTYFDTYGRFPRMSVATVSCNKRFTNTVYVGSILLPVTMGDG